MVATAFPGASNSQLSELYSSLVSKGVQANVIKYLHNTNPKSADVYTVSLPTSGSGIITGTHADMVKAIYGWLTDSNAGNASNALGLTGVPLSKIQGLRVQVIDADGTTAFDSSADVTLDSDSFCNNLTTISNIGSAVTYSTSLGGVVANTNNIVPNVRSVKTTFTDPTVTISTASYGTTYPSNNNGKYIINENQGTRSYNMNAALSQSGVAYQKKYSNTVF